MPRCPSCGEALRGDSERMRARCPHCREPLYERPTPTDQRRGADDEGACLTHPQNRGVGTCQRCGNFLCAVCRTRWRNQALCVACLERALEQKEATAEETQSHYRQAVAALLCGLGAWGSGLLGFILMVTAVGGVQANSMAVMLILPGGVLCLIAAMLAFGGIGQGVAAIRARGDHMILATAGLILSCLQPGAIIGLFSFAFWRE